MQAGGPDYSVYLSSLRESADSPTLQDRSSYNCELKKLPSYVETVVAGIVERFPIGKHQIFRLRY